MFAMKTTRPSECLSDLALDEHLARELEDAARSEVEAHLAGCARCQQRRGRLEREHAAFLERAPSFHAHARRVAMAGGDRGRVREEADGEHAHEHGRDHDRADAPPARVTRLRLLSFATALGAAAAVLLFRVVPGLEPPVLTTRSKGAPHLGFFVSREGKVTRGVEGQTVHPGDGLRFTYSADRAWHLAILDRDERAASVFFPGTARAARIGAGSDVALDFSVELDAQLGDERIHAVFCPEAFDVEPLRAALERSAGLPVAAGCTVSVITLHKAPPP